MMSQFRRVWLAALVTLACCLVQSQRASAQFDFLKSLFDANQQPQARFAGHGQLGLAVQQAAKGEIKESLQSVRDAFQSGGPNEPLGDQDAMSISQMLLQLSRVWREKNAPAGEVAAVLRDAVLPLMPAGEVFPYPIASFDVVAGELAQRSGHDFDGAYFQSHCMATTKSAVGFRTLPTANRF
jgi:hypothetical protein